jgi:hypothetical protein
VGGRDGEKEGLLQEEGIKTVSGVEVAKWRRVARRTNWSRDKLNN